MQCQTCQHGAKNRGDFVPREAMPWKCFRLEQDRGAAAEVLAKMLLRDASEGRCIEHAPFEQHLDSYLSEDLDTEAGT